MTQLGNRKCHAGRRAYGNGVRVARPSTLVTTINPLTSGGRLRSGWTVTDDGGTGGEPIDCT